MGRRTFNELSTHFANENLKEQVSGDEDDGELGLATEAFTGGLAGLLGSIIPGVGFVVSGTVRGHLKAKEKELEALTKTLKRLTVDAGKQAVASGKMEADDFHKLESVDVMDFLLGALLGSIPIINVIVGYSQGSEIQDTLADIKKVKAEIDELLLRAATEQAKAKK